MKHLFPTYKRFPFELVKGNGVTLTDNNGKQYLDLTAGIGVCNLGYNTAPIKAAVKDQLDKIWHTSNLYESSLQEKVAALLVKNEAKDVYFCNSGTEANEAALKLARKASGKNKVLAFDHSFHGRSYGSLSLTGNAKIKEGFGPLVPNVKFAIYNDPQALTEITSDLAAVILEIIQGEGGVVTGDPAWLKAVAAKCKEEKVLLIIDEVQTGIGRTGTLFAYQHYNLDPDIVTLAKGLANGLPVGAMIGKAELAPAFGPGSHGTTFGGNPLAMASAAAVLKILDHEFLESVQQKSLFLWHYLLKEIQPLELVREVSGKGLMVGIHLKEDIKVEKIITSLQKQGILTLSSRDNTLRLLPPLIITGSELLHAVQIIKSTLANAIISQ
ncbi:acetylornithine transaminase [Liquorilactobacillus capillatus]|uniref:Acetylornithine aminotransferase n=1 Tax=Liquorilactobacillus capillatus DSM 19910 TaxID=1423731 RepID=A0A0R1M7K0_9LACO|nr:acetylornithine transaminase [Liquorilactobacillus capillatus]KRL00882.1 acetylornithine aminotransferase [Liquorilactobacillus capillatus DSM 19910]